MPPAGQSGKRTLQQPTRTAFPKAPTNFGTITDLLAGYAATRTGAGRELSSAMIVPITAINPATCSQKLNQT